jgi:hypothetical protein
VDAVVVTGAHRSGTSLLGDIVSQAPGTWTVWEPFNRHWGLRDVRVAYPYLPRSEHPVAPVTSLQRYLRTGRARWSVKQAPGGPSLPALRAAVKSSRRWVTWLGNAGKVPVVKDPFVLLAMAALQPTITSRPVVVSVRHPCSWILSLRRMSWPAGPELNHLIAQPALYEEHLARLLPRRDWTRADDLEAGATAWMCLYHMVNVQASAGARVSVVPLEAFGRDPVGTMGLVFRTLDIDAPPDLDALAATYAGEGNAVTPAGGTKHLLQRNSRALNEAWKGKLSAAEVARVRRITEPVYATVYATWETAEATPR